MVTAKIAFIGLGSMGGPLARLIAGGRYPLTVFDPSAEAAAGFDGLCTVAGSAQEASRHADILCICVRDEAQVRAVLFDDRAATALAPGATILIHSTISVAAARDIAATLATGGVRMLDAPVSRTRQSTEERFVYTMLGGADADVEAVRPVLSLFSTDIGHMGPLGAGMATKIANNLTTWMHIIVGVQAAELAIGNGVPLEKLLDVMRSNGNLTPTVQAALAGKFGVAPDPARTAFMRSQGGIGEKDLSIAHDAALALDLDVAVIDAGRSMVHATMNPGGSD